MKARVERDQILSLLRERIFAFAASRLRKDLAEEVAQDVLLIIHRKYPDVAAVEELVPLGFKIARLRLMSVSRSMRSHGEFDPLPIDEFDLPHPGPDPSQAAERKEQTERLAAAIRQLGHRCKELIRLKLEGRSFPEIQKLLGVSSLNTLYTWDHRCRKQILESLGGASEIPK